MKPKRIYPTKEELIANRKFYKYKRLKYKGRRMIFDQDIRTGVCCLCKRSDKKKEITRTVLHHLKYNDSDPLKWTVEICLSCHYQVDEKNKKRIDMFYARKECNSEKTLQSTQIRHKIPRIESR